MSEWALRRFWTDARAVEADGGFSIELDGRPVRTPAKALLTVPSLALAQAVAEEWQAQEKTVDPGSMPLTRLANSTLDKVAAQHVAVADFLAEYGGSDLLCYRAEGPEALVERQAAEWDPLLDWIAGAEGIRLNVQNGIMPVTQPESAIARIAALTRALPAHDLAGFHEYVTLSGSWVIGWAGLSGAWDTETLWQAANLDELWQAEIWGDDEEALQTRANRKSAFDTARRFLALSRQS